MSELVIGSGTEVTLHFSLRLGSGEVVEDTRQYDRPAMFQVGDGQLLPGFERKLIGLRSGTRRSFMIPARDAFGEPKADNIQTHAKKGLGELSDNLNELRPGLVIGFKDTQGQEVPGVLREVNEHNVVIDFNHPLAGRDLIFEADILDVQAVATPVTLLAANGADSTKGE